MSASCRGKRTRRKKGGKGEKEEKKKRMRNEEGGKQRHVRLRKNEARVFISYDMNESSRKKRL